MRPSILILALLLFAAACSGGDDPQLETAADPTPTSEAGEVLSDEGDEGDDTTDEPTEAPAPAEDGEGDEPDAEPTTAPDVDLEGAAFTERSKLTTVGIDEVFFGMAVDVAAGAASTEWVGAPTPLTSCYFVQPVNGPDGISFMVWNGFVERVDIATPVITTRSGAGVGSTEQELRDLFGANLQAEEATGGLQFVPSDEADAEFRIIFDFDGTDAVTSMRAGRVGQVELSGCDEDA